MPRQTMLLLISAKDRLALQMQTNLARGYATLVERDVAEKKEGMEKQLEQSGFEENKMTPTQTENLPRWMHFSQK